MAAARSSTQLRDPEHEVGSAARARAVALPAEERRAAILAATVPLLVSHGTEITTRQIAAAAGIAEGTIFRVFPDKESLIQAAVEQAFDPDPVEAELLAIDPTLPLEVRLEAAVNILQHWLASVWRIMTAVGVSNLPEGRRAKKGRKGPTSLRALASVFEPDRARLRLDPTQAADLLRNLTFASGHPALTVDSPLSPQEIVSVILDGIRAHPKGAATC
ncbi:MAG: TetR/AcrR family transcriptional regulator [Acidimicrobiia bacterium]